MPGRTIAISRNGTPARCKRLAKLGNPQIRIINDCMDAVPDEQDVGHAPLSFDDCARGAPVRR